jgi:hypothetical protein
MHRQRQRTHTNTRATDSQLFGQRQKKKTAQSLPALKAKTELGVMHMHCAPAHLKRVAIQQYEASLGVSVRITHAADHYLPIGQAVAGVQVRQPGFLKGIKRAGSQQGE